ncbi:OmpP1/FadL family transporter [Desulfobaculum bizertense]|uniref:Long-chain fatty acid transport protein n=1 Tax=Desulfobaculum bizertense DSM 18034 TaxID=1121442 RepID=A0A1T4VIP3_9BACT|nr:OmpP1/FadL family transporter [Desulfobaculum bizertense]UIJ37922.1 OmpP1/FadL family transporter [Desulfobaculum bizertense]SKA64758.1 long-chain fatty acid transport protein [Desulfobaculum bizertense DSM 18034]
MKTALRNCLLALLLVMCTAVGAQAAGYGLYEFSARGNALGGSLVARTPDAAAAAFNPANTTNLPGTHMQFGATFINPYSKIDFENFSGAYEDATGKSNVWVPPHFYITHQLNDRFWLNLGVMSRFGLGTEFEETWTGRYNVNFASINAFSVNPTIAWKMTDKLSLAVGPEFMWFKYRSDKVVDGNSVIYKAKNGPGASRVPGSVGMTGVPQDPTSHGEDIDAMLEGDSVGLGFTAALHYQINKDWAAGLTYRSQMKQEVRGEATFSLPNSSNPANNAFYSTLFKNSSAGAKIILPDEVFAGVSWQATPKLSLEADLVWTNWSLYRTLTVEYDDLPAQEASISDKNWRDAWRVQLGAEYAYSDALTLRCGYVWDQSPIHGDQADYMIPTGDRHLFSVGTGYRFNENWTVDLSYTYLIAQDRSFDNRPAEGVFESEAHDTVTHLYGITVGYDF